MQPKRFNFWLKNDLIPDSLPEDLTALYAHVLSLFQANENCFTWTGDRIVIQEDIIMQSVLQGDTALITDDTYRNSFLYDARKKTIALDQLSDSTIELVKEHLLSCDALRADFERYDENILTDPNRGHWGLWQDEHYQSPYTAKIHTPLIARNRQPILIQMALSELILVQKARLWSIRITRNILSRCESEQAIILRKPILNNTKTQRLWN